MYMMFLVNQVPMADVIVPTTRENLMIAPSTIQLAGAENRVDEPTTSWTTLEGSREED